MNPEMKKIIGKCGSVVDNGSGGMHTMLDLSQGIVLIKVTLAGHIVTQLLNEVYIMGST